MIDERMEAIYRRVTLVRGAGNPRRAQFCVMSFVALLAGERHNDHPQAASPLIRQFAVVINDAMPGDIRQRLKPFAPRILGTNDGMDQLRAEALLAFARDELLRLVDAELEAADGRTLSWLTTSGRRRMTLIGFHSAVQQALEAPCDLTSFSERRALATAVATLLCRAVTVARDRDAATRYWAMALDMLDRLCDIREWPAAAANLAGLAAVATGRLVAAGQAQDGRARWRLSLWAIGD